MQQFLAAVSNFCGLALFWHVVLLAWGYLVLLLSQHSLFVGAEVTVCLYHAGNRLDASPRACDVTHGLADTRRCTPAVLAEH